MHGQCVWAPIPSLPYTLRSRAPTPFWTFSSALKERERKKRPMGAFKEPGLHSMGCGRFSKCEFLMRFIYSCNVNAAVSCLMAWVSGPVTESPPPHFKPPHQPSPLRLLLLWMRMAPFPQHRSAGTAFTVKSVWTEIEWGREVDTEMSRGDRERELQSGV